MRFTFPLTLLFVLLCVPCGFAQEEPPLEPIPLPAPVGKADDVQANHRVEAIDQEVIEMPLEGPVFPDGSVIIEQPPQSPTQLQAPPAATYERAAEATFELAPSGNGRASDGRLHQQASYQQTQPYPGGSGVVVYQVTPFSRVTRYGVTQMAPAVYTADVPVPARFVGPYPVYRVGTMPAFGPPSPIVPLAYPLRPVPYMPGQPVRNAIRSVLW